MSTDARAATPARQRPPATRQQPTPTRQGSSASKHKRLSVSHHTPPGSPSARHGRDSVRDSVRVIARLRPEHTEHPHAVQAIDETSLSAGGDVYTFDRVFGPGSSQEEVFAYALAQTVDDLFAGYNGTVLAYGQTGSGKTYTMMGAQLHDTQRGMIPRMSDAIFQRMLSEKRHEEQDPTEYTLSASYMEIYMEQVRDLLSPDSSLPLVIQEDGVNGVHVRNLTKRYVGSSEELYSLLEKGAQLRAVASTSMNQESSRSHAIFQLDLTQENVRDGVKRSKLFLVDLAGSEKVGKTGASGQTLEEAKKINSSLTHLGIVINALTDSKSTHIPYRDSKLTRILQQSLGGNARTSLIVNCSPASYNESETLSTLRFGTRAKKIKNKAHVNSEPSQLDLLKRIEQLTMINNQHELRSKELEYELDLWKTGINKLPDTAQETSPPPPPPPPKNVPPTTSPDDLKKMSYLENRVQELTTMMHQAPHITSTSANDLSLVKQLEESQSLNGVLLEDLNDKCLKLYEMQQEIDKLASQLQTRYDEEQVMAIEQTLVTFTTKVAELENQNYMLQKEIKTTRNIAETRQERIKTLEEMVKETQSKINHESNNFEFKLFSLKERLQSARKLSNGSTINHSVTTTGNGTGNHVGMSKIDENHGPKDVSPFGGPLGDSASVLVHKVHEINGSDETLMSMKSTHTRATSVTSQLTSSTSSGGSIGMRFGLNLNIVKPNVQSLSLE